MRWHVIHARRGDAAEAVRDEETFAFYGKTLTGAKEQRPRWKRCVDATDGDLGEALGKVYVERTFGAEGKARTLQMVQAIEAALGTDIKEISWMSDETKKQAAGQAARRRQQDRLSRPLARLLVAAHRPRRRLRQLAARATPSLTAAQMAKIGKPVDKTEWLMTPPTVNAYYNPLENNINFPGRHPAAALLQQGRRTMP